jgi:hypothetical protein
VALSASADVLHSVSAFAQSPLRPGVLDDITDVASVAALRKQVRARAQSFDTTSASRTRSRPPERVPGGSPARRISRTSLRRTRYRKPRVPRRGARGPRGEPRVEPTPRSRDREEKNARRVVSFFSPSMDRFISRIIGARHTARLEAHSISPSADTPPL